MILDTDLEPEIETTTIGNRFQTDVKNPFDINFESVLLNIEILKDKKYTPIELISIIKSRFPDVTIKKENFSLKVHRKHGDIETIITIYNEGVVFAPYILAETKQPLIGNVTPDTLVKYRYGNISHGRIQIT